VPSVATALPELSLSDWTVLGVVAERPTHGWPVVRELGTDGQLGRVWTVARPIVYRSLNTLVAQGLVEQHGEALGRGPQRTIMRATRRGKAAFRRWLQIPVSHVRDMRSEFLVKLAFLARANVPADALIERQIRELTPVLRALSARPTGDGFDLVLARWRREQALALERFLRALQR
jgi:DNA-binding PadR family transcriptional regulator